MAQGCLLCFMQFAKFLQCAVSSRCPRRKALHKKSLTRIKRGCRDLQSRAAFRAQRQHPRLQSAPVHSTQKNSWPPRTGYPMAKIHPCPAYSRRLQNSLPHPRPLQWNHARRTIDTNMCRRTAPGQIAAPGRRGENWHGHSNYPHAKPRPKAR